MASDRQNRSTTSRRTYLKLTGAVTASAAVMGSASASKSDYEDQYGTVVDVTEAGADDDGNESVTPILEEHAGDDTLLYFPSGRYYMDDQLRFTGFENFGIIGEGAELVPGTYSDFEDNGGHHRLFRLGVDDDPGRDLRFEGFTVDQTAGNTGTRVLEAAIDDGLVVRDIDIDGEHDSGTWGPGRFVITDPDGEGLIENFNAPDGAAYSSETPDGSLRRGPTGILCNDYNDGTMTFRNCVLDGFPDNGLYAANGSGTVQIEGGRYQGCTAANIRLGGTGSYIKDSTVIVDQENPNGIGQLGLRFEKGELLSARNVDFRTNIDESPAIVATKNASYCYVDDCTVTVRTDGPCMGILIRDSAGMMRIKRTQLKHETGGGAAIKVRENDDPVYLEDVSISGESPTNGTRSAIQNYRDDSEFRNVTVDYGGGSGRRALTNEGDDCLIYEGSYVSEAHPLEDGGTGTWIEGVSAEARGDDVSLLLKSSAEDIYVKKCDLEDGIDDRSSDGYDGYGNDL